MVKVLMINDFSDPHPGSLISVEYTKVVYIEKIYAPPTLICDLFSSSVSLKIRERSPKSLKGFILCKPSSKYFYRSFQASTSFVDRLCYLCLVFVMLSRLFIAALWSPEGKWLTSWLLFVMFIVILLLSHLVSWDRFGT